MCRKKNTLKIIITDKIRTELCENYCSVLQIDQDELLQTKMLSVFSIFIKNHLEVVKFYFSFVPKNTYNYMIPKNLW